jgi:hypothetical protein
LINLCWKWILLLLLGNQCVENKKLFSEHLCNQIQIIVKWFLSLLFTKLMFEKHIASSMLPITMVMANSIYFNHSNSQWERSWLFAKVHQMWMQALYSCEVAWELTNIISLKNGNYCTNNVSSIKLWKMYFNPIIFP